MSIVIHRAAGRLGACAGRGSPAPDQDYAAQVRQHVVRHI